ncbi:MAG: Rieske 2Fe-2S domain-containing protein [Phycisphaerae bacterium]|nr:Rieske 2Fe-2S domain-containing protein [Phycisphaerae bacterium]
MKKISRKAFIVGGVTAAATGACLCTKTGRATIFGVGDTPPIASDAYDIAEDKSIRIHLDRVPELAFDGGSIKILDTAIDDSLIIVRIAENDYVASSIKCTHRGVEVEYQAQDKCFKCASLGGSTFKTSGEKIHGFAKSPLKTYPVSTEGDTLVVRLS